MKNTVKIFGIITLITVIGFSMTACVDKEIPPEEIMTEAVYKGIDSAANYYELIISKAADRAAYSPVTGDDYIMTVTPPNGSGKTSEGTVDQSVDGGFVLKPNGATKVFNVAVDGGNIIAIAGEIKYTSGSLEEKTVVMNPSAVGGTTISSGTIVSGANVAYDPDLANLAAAKAVTDFPYALDFGGDGGPSGVNMSTVLDGTTAITVNNGKVFITVGTPKPEVLQGFEEFAAAGMEVTPSTAKYFGSEGSPVIFTNIEGTPENYNTMYGLICVKGTDNYAGLTYLSEETTIKGSMINPDGPNGIKVDIFDMTAKQGWNYVFTSTYGIYTIYSASKTLPAGYKWTVIDQNTKIKIGIEGGGGNSSLSGTWVNSEGDWKITLYNDGNYEKSENNKLMEKGSYSVRENNITVTTTHLSKDWITENFPDLDPESFWYTQDELSTLLTDNEITQDISENYKNQDGTYTLNGDTLSITLDGETIVLTRQR